MITGLLKLGMEDHISKQIWWYFILDLDYKIEDGTTYWRYEDATYQEHKKANTNSKYFSVSTTGERKMISDFRYIVELLVQNHTFDMYEVMGS